MMTDELRSIGRSQGKPAFSPSASKMAMLLRASQPKPPAPMVSIGAPPEYFTSEGYTQSYLAAPAQQTATLPSQKKASKSAVDLARRKQAAATAASTKKSKTFAVARSGKGKILDETKMDAKRLKTIM